MTWNAFHTRGEILRDVITTADRTRDGHLPMTVPGVSEHFADELDLLSALMLKWHARLSGNIERALMSEPLDLEQAVARAWRRTCEEMPGVRAIIDRHTDAPGDPRMGAALARAQEREWLRLAAAAGLANDESPAAARAGRRIETEARALNLAEVAVDQRAEELAVAEPKASEPTSFVERLKAVIAA